jgi:hypothetical protein
MRSASGRQWVYGYCTSNGRKWLCTSTRAHTHTRTRIHARAHTHTHTCTHRHTCTRTHNPTPKVLYKQLPQVAVRAEGLRVPSRPQGRAASPLCLPDAVLNASLTLYSRYSRVPRVVRTHGYPERGCRMRSAVAVCCMRAGRVRHLRRDLPCRMWQGRAQSRRRCGRGMPPPVASDRPGAHVAHHSGMPLYTHAGMCAAHAMAAPPTYRAPYSVCPRRTTRVCLFAV